MVEDPITQRHEAATRFADWLKNELVAAARGDRHFALAGEDAGPSTRFWLGRIASEETVREIGWDDRGQRLDPCAIGVSFKTQGNGPWSLDVSARFKLWTHTNEEGWSKSDELVVEDRVEVENEYGSSNVLNENFANAFNARGVGSIYGASIRLEVFPQTDPSTGATTRHFSVELVNHSDARRGKTDTNFYEAALSVRFSDYDYLFLEDIPGSFRYDRRVRCRGINCGVEHTSDDWFHTLDTIDQFTHRPTFETEHIAELDFTFKNLIENPIRFGETLAEKMRAWGSATWSDQALEAMAAEHDWTEEMLAEAKDEAAKFWDEVGRVEAGARFLRNDADALKAFQLMNEAMQLQAQGQYDQWRSFQAGFLYTLLPSLSEEQGERDIVDIVWFATGGGKTETYLGAIVTWAFYDRLRGKTHGVTAWSRFPLRMLSMQQTQRFANAMAAAEQVREKHGIGGEVFSLGFFVGKNGTPNAIKEEPEHGEPDPYDPTMPQRYQVLLQCPFCRHETISMRFNYELWRLEHRCNNKECKRYEDDLLIRIVDQEIYRYLPTTIVGTLDKAALVGMQAASAGLLGPPVAQCSVPEHGFCYTHRKSRPNGCLVPGCNSATQTLPQEARFFGTSLRLQDELHLLKDSLGAVDAHYEAILDGIQYDRTDTRPKILASSATLSGFEKQCRVLYRRAARVFPVEPPTRESGFWVSVTNQRLRTFVGLAPRGVTIEYALDQLLIILQKRVREILARPEKLKDLGIDPSLAGFLVSMYGVDITYGNTRRDLDAVRRSLPNQVAPHLDGTLRAAELTGGTHFEDVRTVLKELDAPQEDYEDRLHVIRASSMMSHGVDIDRLNVMAMIGVPLSTSEFIQATARVGRRQTGLVFVFHRMARERDAVIYKNFDHFVANADRLIEPIPITDRSRRVLEKTLPGIFASRILLLRELEKKERLYWVNELQKLLQEGHLSHDEEVRAVERYLGLNGDLDEFLIEDVRNAVSQIIENIQHPTKNGASIQDVYPESGPMRSLRDVEETVKVVTRRIR